ncbi:MAG: isochorismatase family protein [Deltaproteobacteria bacterium]|nr:isochorismatase family protein [Deltaproteobacteria bacterium]
MDDLALSPRRAALLVIDLQERLVPAMPPAIAERVIANTRIAIAAAARLDMPIVVTEQYPKGLGPTVAPIEEALAAAPVVHRFDKLAFSACSTDAFAALWPALRRDQWLVAGMEAHVCVWQSVRDLRGKAAHVHVLTDAVSSRTKANWRIGTGLSAAAGAHLSSTEVALFDLLGRAGTDAFKALSKLIK